MREALRQQNDPSKPTRPSSTAAVFSDDAPASCKSDRFLVLYLPDRRRPPIRLWARHYTLPVTLGGKQPYRARATSQQAVSAFCCLPSLTLTTRRYRSAVCWRSPGSPFPSVLPQICSGFNVYFVQLHLQSSPFPVPHPSKKPPNANALPPGENGVYKVWKTIIPEITNTGGGVSSPPVSAQASPVWLRPVAAHAHWQQPVQRLVVLARVVPVSVPVAWAAFGHSRTSTVSSREI